jgi:hypothetical protein
MQITLELPEDIVQELRSKHCLRRGRIEYPVTWSVRRR